MHVLETMVSCSHFLLMHLQLLAHLVVDEMKDERIVIEIIAQTHICDGSALARHFAAASRFSFISKYSIRLTT